MKLFFTSEISRPVLSVLQPRVPCVQARFVKVPLWNLVWTEIGTFNN